MGKCLLCGQETSGTFESSQRRILKNAAASAMAPIVPPRPVIMREAPPAGLPNWESHVQVPRSQAITSGLFAAPIGGILFYGAASLISLSSTSFELTNSGLFVWGLFGALLFGFSVAWWKWEVKQNKYDSLLYRVEEWTGIDLNGDEIIGEPEAQPKVIPIEIVDKNGVPRQVEELETDYDRFGILAWLIIIDGKGFSEETASDAGYTRKEWVKIRDKFIKREWAGWNNAAHPKQGVSLLEQGEKILKGHLPPTLPGVAAMNQKSPVGTNVEGRTNGLRSNNGFVFTEE